MPRSEKPRVWRTIALIKSQEVANFNPLVFWTNGLLGEFKGIWTNSGTSCNRTDVFQPVCPEGNMRLLELIAIGLGKKNHTR